jgi:hypothetical protein
MESGEIATKSRFCQWRFSAGRCERFFFHPDGGGETGKQEGDEEHEGNHFLDGINAINRMGEAGESDPFSLSCFSSASCLPVGIRAAGSG